MTGPADLSLENAIPTSYICRRKVRQMSRMHKLIFLFKVSVVSISERSA